MADLGRDLGRVVLLLAGLAGAALVPSLAAPAAVSAAGDADTLLIQFENEDLAVVRHLNGGDIEAADMISNRLLERLDRALSDPGLSAYHDRFRALKARVGRFDDEYLDPRTGDHDDLKLWPEQTPVDWVPAFVADWRQSWETGDIDAYLSHYSERFRSDRRSGEMELSDWGERKRLLARSRPDLRIDVDDLRVYRQDGQVIAYFRQNYRSSRFESVGYKSLVLVREPEGWRIFREITGPASPRGRPVMTAELPQAPQPPIQPPPAPEPTPAAPLPDPADKVREMVSSWEAAWEAMDLDAYLSHYSAAGFKRGDLDAWGHRKRALWESARFIKVELEDLTVSVDNNSALVKFAQSYRSHSYGDDGRKTLHLVKEEGGWKIVDERWERR